MYIQPVYAPYWRVYAADTSYVTVNSIWQWVLRELYLYASPDCSGPRLTFSNITSYGNYYSSSYLPPSVLDGNDTNAWLSSYSGPQWLKVDSATPVSVQSAKLVTHCIASGMVGPKKLSFQYSSDGTNWTTLTTVAVANATVDGTVRIFTNLQAFGYSGHFFTGFQQPLPQVTFDFINVPVNSQSLAFTQYPATVQTGYSEIINASAYSLAFTVNPSLAVGNAHTEVTRQDLAFTQYPVSVTAQMNTSVNAGSQTFTFTQNPATITAGVTVSPATQPLTFDLYGVSVESDTAVSVNVPTNYLHLTQYPVSVSGEVVVATALQELHLTQYEVSVVTGCIVPAALQSLTFTQHAVSVESNIATSVGVTTQNLSFVVFPVTQTGQGEVAVNYGLMQFTPHTAEIHTNSTLLVGYQSLSFSIFPTTVDLTQGSTIDVDTQSLQFSLLGVSVNTGWSESVSSQTMTFTQYPVGISTVEEVTPDVQTLVFTQYPAETSVTVSANTATQAMNFEVYAAAVSVMDNPVIAVPVHTMTFTQYPVSISASSTVETAKQDLLFTQYPTTVSAGAGITVAKQDLLFTLFHPTQIGEILYVDGIMTMEARVLKPYMEAYAAFPHMAVEIKKPFMTGEIE